MTHTIIHNKIVGGKFVDGTEVVVLKSVEEATNYYESKLKQPLARRIRDNRLALLTSFKKMADDAAKSEMVVGDDPDKLLSVVNMHSFRDLATMQESDKEDTPSKKGLTIRLSWPNIWKAHFYQFKNFKGRKVSLDLQWKDYDLDKDLTNNDFNDRTSSIDTGKLVPLTIGARDTYFRGDRWYFYVDDKNLANNGCDNCFSSIAATGLSLTRILQILAAIAG